MIQVPMPVVTDATSATTVSKAPDTSEGPAAANEQVIKAEPVSVTADKAAVSEDAASEAVSSDRVEVSRGSGCIADFGIEHLLILLVVIIVVMILMK